ncbi:MAG: hypothetical protein ACI9ZF_003720 [Bradyrhizobium sp.]|jgi:hypothetical protein
MCRNKEDKFVIFKFTQFNLIKIIFKTNYQKKMLLKG